MKSMLKTAFMFKIQDHLYPFSIMIAYLKAPKREITDRRTICNLLNATFKEKVIKKYGIIGKGNIEEGVMVLLQGVTLYK